ncbi:MAG: alpha/beta hydrolase-fold protein [Pseudoxanthomonas sp.]
MTTALPFRSILRTGLLGLLIFGAGMARAADTGPRIEVSFAKAARAEPVTGRVYVAISRDNDKPPIEQADSTGVPLFGHNVEALAPGAAAAITADDFGAPLASLRELPAGEYWMQPFVNVYTRFPRADGHVVWLHMDQWEGQDWKRSPGNLYGEPVKVRFDPASSQPIRLVADKAIAPIPFPADTDQVKRFRMTSKLLSDWWGQPIFLGATVLLPKDYDRHPDTRYPVIYDHGHFSTGAPYGFDRPNSKFRDYWLADGTPRFILVTLQHPSPYYDDSYAVNSENLGPYDDAINRELIPEVERRFRVVGEPWARILTGGSTGGWIAAAQQIFHPAFYGGSFALCPDALDFRHHQVVNLYEDANAYWLDKGWVKVERVSARQPDGNIDVMMKDENWYELAVGDRSRSGGQWDIWEAAFGPVGADGYPQRIWDKRTGAIDHRVAAYWKEHFDLRHLLESQWATLGPQLHDKLHIYVGDADTYNLNMGVRAMDAFLEKARDPAFDGSVVFQPMAPHCWGPPGKELWELIDAHVRKHAPADADPASWHY